MYICIYVCICVSRSLSMNVYASTWIISRSSHMLPTHRRWLWGTWNWHREEGHCGAPQISWERERERGRVLCCAVLWYAVFCGIFEVAVFVVLYWFFMLRWVSCCVRVPCWGGSGSYIEHCCLSGEWKSTMHSHPHPYTHVFISLSLLLQAAVAAPRRSRYGAHVHKIVHSCVRGGARVYV